MTPCRHGNCPVQCPKCRWFERFLPAALLLALVLAAPTAHAECSSCTEPLTAHSTEGGDWHLLLTSQGGAFQLWRGLTRHECEFMRARALGEPATQAERDAEAAERKDALERWEERRRVFAEKCLTLDDGWHLVEEGAFAGPKFECAGHKFTGGQATNTFTMTTNSSNPWRAECFQ